MHPSVYIIVMEPPLIIFMLIQDSGICLFISSKETFYYKNMNMIFQNKNKGLILHIPMCAYTCSLSLSLSLSLYMYVFMST